MAGRHRRADTPARVRTRHTRDQIELEVWRDAHTGRFASAPAGQRKAAELLRTARRLAGLEDRVDKRLRWGEQTTGWWYMVKGPRYWIRQESKPGWHHGYYYKPGIWTPVVPPRSAWESRDSYYGIPGETPMSGPVPRDVWLAAHMHPEDRAGKRMGEDSSVRRERFGTRVGRSGYGGRGEDAKDSKRFKGRTIKKKK